MVDQQQVRRPILRDCFKPRKGFSRSLCWIDWAGGAMDRVFTKAAVQIAAASFHGLEVLIADQRLA